MIYRSFFLIHLVSALPVWASPGGVAEIPYEWNDVPRSVAVGAHKLLLFLLLLRLFWRYIHKSNLY